MMLIISKIDYHFFEVCRSGSGGILYLRILVTFTPLGIAVNGKRWLGTRSLRFQPAELVKIVMILFLAVVITRLGKRINEWRVWGMLAVLLGPLALFVMLNNLSSGIIICGIAFVMMFVACKRKWPFYIGRGADRRDRIRPCGHRHGESGNPSLLPAEQNPGMEKSGGIPEVRRISGLTGTLCDRFRRTSRKGLGQSIQKLSFLPEPQNDMIFAVICEELTFRRDRRDLHVPLHAVPFPVIAETRRICSVRCW